MFTESFFFLLEPHYDHYDANANNYNNINMLIARIISNRLLSGQPLARAAAQALGVTASNPPISQRILVRQPQVTLVLTTEGVGRLIFDLHGQSSSVGR